MPRAGVAQFSGSKNLEENVEAVRRLTARAAEAGVNLLGFHELASTLYLPFSEDPKLFDLAQPDTGPSVTAVREIARKHQMVIVFPFFEKDGQYYYNSAVAVGPRGDILSKYRKTSVPTVRLLPATNEQHFFRNGNLGFPVVDTPFGVRVGMIICYDRNLPEPARCAALNGTDLLYIPITTTTLVRPWWELLLRARAVENIMYVGAPSRIGEDKGGAPGTSYIGESLIVDPKGEVLAHASEEKEDVVWADLDMEQLHQQRKSWTFFIDRRPDLYGILSREQPGPTPDVVV